MDRSRRTWINYQEERKSIGVGHWLSIEATIVCVGESRVTVLVTTNRPVARSTPSQAAMPCMASHGTAPQFWLGYVSVRKSPIKTWATNQGARA